MGTQNGQATPSDDAAALDQQALDTLVALFGDEGPSAITALIDEFFSELATTLPKMDTAVVQQDSNSLYVLAHTLKSSSANMGAASVTIIAKKIEAAARAGEMPSAIAELAELKNEVPRVQRAFEIYRAALGN